MNAEYKDIRSEADRIYHRFKDKADAPDAPEMQALGRQLKQIVEDIDSGRDARNIESRIKQAQETIRDVKSHGAALMDGGDADELLDGCEELREDVRELPNY